MGTTFTFKNKQLLADLKMFQYIETEYGTVKITLPRLIEKIVTDWLDAQGKKELI